VWVSLYPPLYHFNSIKRMKLLTLLYLPLSFLFSELIVSLPMLAESQVEFSFFEILQLLTCELFQSAVRIFISEPPLFLVLPLFVGAHDPFFDSGPIEHPPEENRCYPGSRNLPSHSSFAEADQLSCRIPAPDYFFLRSLHYRVSSYRWRAFRSPALHSKVFLHSVAFWAFDLTPYCL